MFEPDQVGGGTVILKRVVVLVCLDGGQKICIDVRTPDQHSVHEVGQVCF